jgi:hypothetical protein
LTDHRWLSDSLLVVCDVRCVCSYIRLGSAYVTYGCLNVGVSHSHKQWIIVDLDLVSLFSNVNCCVFLICTVKACRGTRSISPPIRNLGIRWRWVVNFRTAALTPRKTPGCYRRGGLAVPSAGLDGLEKRKCLAPTGIRTLARP